MRRIDSIARRAGTQDGFTLLEVLAALAVLSVGMLGLLASFNLAGTASYSAQRHEQAVAVAQAEIERLKALDYSDLALTAAPANQPAGNPAGDPAPQNPVNPNFYVTGSGFKVMNNYRDSGSGTVTGTPAAGEPFVVSASGAVNPGPEDFDNGQASGRIYRYVTWRDDACTGLVCLGPQDGKRITVAVSMNVAGNGAPPSKPIYISSIVTDPRGAPPNSLLPPETDPGAANPSQLQPFFLSNTPCNQSSSQTPVTSNTTHNTFQALGSCLLAPHQDLMDLDPAATVSPAPDLQNYSTDLSRTSPSGLALTRNPGASACPTAPYTVTQALANPSVKYSVHAWATPTITAFAIPAGGQAFVQLWTKTVDGVADKSVTLCATLRKQSTGTVIGSTSYSPSGGWPATYSKLSFAIKPLALTALVADRLVLALGVMPSSQADIEIAYDHQSYQTSLGVETTTPLT
jgi:prepilin-type N-terminal cleavage/methylation domain-containing protein